MPSNKTFITFTNIKEFFIEKCKDQNLEYSDKNFTLYLELCENDFYQWLKDNFRYYFSENFIEKTFTKS